jgi:hypothetical protein
VVSITHIALGGYMGEAFSGIQIGKMAMIGAQWLRASLTLIP